MLFAHLIRAAASRTFCTAGSNRPIRIAMIAITTSNSINVKAWRERGGGGGSSVGVGGAAGHGGVLGGGRKRPPQRKHDAVAEPLKSQAVPPPRSLPSGHPLTTP